MDVQTSLKVETVKLAADVLTELEAKEKKILKQQLDIVSSPQCSCV